jgi:hypothetical protein
MQISTTVEAICNMQQMLQQWRQPATVLVRMLHQLPLMHGFFEMKFLSIRTIGAHVNEEVPKGACQ